MRPAKRSEALPVHIFATLGAKLKYLQGQGLDVIRLDIGSPDGPPTPEVVQALHSSALDPARHGYAGYAGTSALRQAIADYYLKRFNVSLDASEEIVVLIGSKEGIVNMSLAWLDPGELALVPDPSYPTYQAGALLAGASTYVLPLLEANGFLPDLGAIPIDVAERARLLWLNYPNNPTGAAASIRFFEYAVEFCERHGMLLCHDAPYADVWYEDYRPPSLLAVPGAKKVAIEFNSLSKSHNMAGWRLGMAVGNRIAVRALSQMKTNVDSGIFLPIQDAATVALTQDQGWIAGRNREYEYRRDLLLDVLVNAWGVHCLKPLAGLYLWSHVPTGFSAGDFADHVLTNTGVSITPGTAFGRYGEGFLRISLGQSTPRVEEAARRLRALVI